MNIRQISVNKRARAQGCVPFGKVVIKGDDDIDMNFFFVDEIEQREFVNEAFRNGFIILDKFFGYSMYTRADHALTVLDRCSDRLRQKGNELVT